MAKHAAKRHILRASLKPAGIFTVTAGIAALAVAYPPGALLSGAATVPAAETPNPEDVTATATDQTTVTVVSGGLSIAKSADKQTVLAGTRVNYSYAVTATGVSFRDVKVTDNKCSPVTGPSGDNGDEILQPGETWLYKCSQPLTTTTTNIGTVTGVPVLNAPSPSGTPTPSPTSTGVAGYKDGTYTGVPTTVTLPEVPGEVYTETVTATIVGGVVSGVTVIHSTIPNHTSLIIATDAEQQLTAQAKANNGKVTNISGATVTSKAFASSLQDALTQAAK